MSLQKLASSLVKEHLGKGSFELFFVHKGPLDRAAKHLEGCGCIVHKDLAVGRLTVTLPAEAGDTESAGLL